MGGYGRGSRPTDPEIQLPEANDHFKGSDHRLPSYVKTPQQLHNLAHKSAVKLQRAANRMIQRLSHLKLFGETPEPGSKFDDFVGVQLLFEMRKALEALPELDLPDPREQLKAVQTRIKGLEAMGHLQQSILMEITRITGNTQKSLTDLARVALEAKRTEKTDDDITDAELVP